MFFGQVGSQFADLNTQPQGESVILRRIVAQDSSFSTKFISQTMLAENTIKKRTGGKKQNKIVARIRARSQKRKEFDSCRESQGWPVKSCVQHGIVSFFLCVSFRHFCSITFYWNFFYCSRFFVAFWGSVARVIFDSIGFHGD